MATCFRSADRFNSRSVVTAFVNPVVVIYGKP